MHGMGFLLSVEFIMITFFWVLKNFHLICLRVDDGDDVGQIFSILMLQVYKVSFL